ncbi:MAG: hypothetical protein R3F11_26150 [Verrucomicrobiales bacterium]
MPESRSGRARLQPHILTASGSPRRSTGKSPPLESGPVGAADADALLAAFLAPESFRLLRS